MTSQNDIEQLIRDFEAAKEDKTSGNRQLIAITLGDLKDSRAVPCLCEALVTDEQVYVREHIAKALESIAAPESIHCLGQALIADKAVGVKYRAANALGAIKHPDAIQYLAQSLAEDQSIRQHVVMALGSIANVAGISCLAKALSDESSSVRVKVIYALRQIGHPDIIPLLVKVIVEDADRDCRRNAAEGLSKFDDWREKVHQVLAALQASNSIHRAQLDSENILRAIRPPETQLDGNVYLLVDHLITQALEQDTRMTGNIAELMVADLGENASLTGERINHYEKVNDVPPDRLRKLRIEVGGASALDPLMKILQDNLKNNFQQPILELNAETRKVWQKTIGMARCGFFIRIIMSIFVFLAGITLVVFAGYQLLFGNLPSEQLLGPGVSFVSGLGILLGLIYSQPLGDIRRSVSELGIANVTFIAYIHRVLQISHTFSFKYLERNLTPDDLDKFNKLVEEASSNAIAQLK